MNIKEIGVIAKTNGTKPGKLKKEDLIHAIKCIGKNFACFVTAYEEQCDQNDCVWRIDCFTKNNRKAH